MDDLINREDAINAIYHHFPNVSMERATEILHECETAEKQGNWTVIHDENFADIYYRCYVDGKRDAEEIILCKDCRKHNVEHGYYPGGHVVRKEDSCPLVAYRGKAQGHEYDYQYCVFGERKDE